MLYLIKSRSFLPRPREKRTRRARLFPTACNSEEAQKVSKPSMSHLKMRLAPDCGHSASAARFTIARRGMRYLAARKKRDGHHTTGREYARSLPPRESHFSRAGRDITGVAGAACAKMARGSFPAIALLMRRLTLASRAIRAGGNVRAHFSSRACE